MPYTESEAEQIQSNTSSDEFLAVHGEPRMITQSELNDLVRHLTQSKSKTELLGS